MKQQQDIMHTLQQNLKQQQHQQQLMLLFQQQQSQPQHQHQHSLPEQSANMLTQSTRQYLSQQSQQQQSVQLQMQHIQQMQRLQQQRQFAAKQQSKQIPAQHQFLGSAGVLPIAKQVAASPSFQTTKWSDYTPAPRVDSLSNLSFETIDKLSFLQEKLRRRALASLFVDYPHLYPKCRIFYERQRKLNRQQRKQEKQTSSQDFASKNPKANSSPSLSSFSGPSTSLRLLNHRTHLRSSYSGVPACSFSVEAVCKRTALMTAEESALLAKDMRAQRQREETARKAEEERNRVLHARSERIQFLLDVKNHHEEFREFHKQRIKHHLSIAKQAVKYVLGAERRKLLLVERRKRERMKALKENDMVAYESMLRSHKDDRLHHLLHQTDDFLRKLGAMVQVEKNVAIDLEATQDTPSRKRPLPTVKSSKSRPESQCNSSQRQSKRPKTAAARRNNIDLTDNSSSKLSSLSSSSLSSSSLSSSSLSSSSLSSSSSLQAPSSSSLLVASSPTSLAPSVRSSITNNSSVTAHSQTRLSCAISPSTILSPSATSLPISSPRVASTSVKFYEIPSPTPLYTPTPSPSPSDSSRTPSPSPCTGHSHPSLHSSTYSRRIIDIATPDSKSVDVSFTASPSNQQPEIIDVDLFDTSDVGEDIPSDHAAEPPISSNEESDANRADSSSGDTSSDESADLQHDRERHLSFDDDEEVDGTGKRTYYTLAHSIEEEISKQPELLSGGTLKQYQLTGLEWLVSLYNNNINGILADEMGLGKTIQTIALFCHLIESKMNNGPFLVVVPLSTLTNWESEFSKWAPDVLTTVYIGKPDERKLVWKTAVQTRKFNVLLTTYEYVMNKLDRSKLASIVWNYIVIDEGHRMKNSQSKLAVTLSTRYTSKHRIILTGTPLQNNLGELWALLNFLLPKIFNSGQNFEEWFNKPFESSGLDNSELNDEEKMLIINRLHQVLRPFILRRMKSEVATQLPDKIERVLKCQLSAWQKVVYEHISSRAIRLVNPQNGKVSSRGLRNILMQLRKICNHPYLFYDEMNYDWDNFKLSDEIFRCSGKFELLDRILPKLKHFGHRILMFSQMTKLMTIMEEYLDYRGHSYLRLDGSTSNKDRGLMLEAFNKPDSPYFIFLLSTRAGGLGLNLQTADTVIIFDSDWNPQMDIQAQDRAHRIGQKKEVRVFRLITASPVEEHILSRAVFKLEMDSIVIQAGKFNKSSTLAERQELLEDILKEKEDDRSRHDIPTDERMNDMLARTDEEFDYFQEYDIKKESIRAAEAKAAGRTSPLPRLTGMDELPSFLINSSENACSSEEERVYGRGCRAKGDVSYVDVVTDHQFARLVEKGEDVKEYNRRKLNKKRVSQRY